MHQDTPLSSDVAAVSVTDLIQDQPHISYGNVQALFSFLHGLSRDTDSVTVTNVTPATLQAIDEAIQARGRKVRLFYLAEQQVATITLPTAAHEALHLAVYEDVLAGIMQMDLRRAWAATGATTYTSTDGSRIEADSSGKPFPGYRDRRDGRHCHWPALVVQSGCTQSLAVLRAKMRFWFAASDHGVKSVVLVKAFQNEEKRILIEQWHEQDAPVCVQTVSIVWAVPGVSYAEASEAQRGDPRSFNVIGGPLRFEFARLFLRQPGPGEQDIVVPDDDLQWHAMRIWGEQGAV